MQDLIDEYKRSHDAVVRRAKELKASIKNQELDSMELCDIQKRIQYLFVESSELLHQIAAMEKHL